MFCFVFSLAGTRTQTESFIGFGFWGVATFVLAQKEK